MKPGVKHNLFLILLFIGFLALSFFILTKVPDWMLAYSKTKKYAVTETGPTGDTFGGTLGPAIAWVAAFLTFLAFWIQYKANNIQRTQLNNQSSDTAIERFENRYFEMIRIHRENVAEQNIQGVVFGRKVFTTFYFELRYLCFVLEDFYQKHPPATPLTLKERTNLSYLIFFYGIGHATDDIFEHLAPKYSAMQFFKETILFLKQKKEAFNQNPSISVWEEKYRKEFMGNTVEVKEISKIKEKLEIVNGDKKAVFLQIYEPFTGHGAKIGHYFRHLFQAVKYVHEQPGKLLDGPKKYEYVKILRAQLSNFEQVMLYYNAVSLIGEPWITEGFIKCYRLLNNLPLTFADFGISPADQFATEIKEDPKFFDWLELRNRM